MSTRRLPLPDELIPVAAQLAATVREQGHDGARHVLAAVPPQYWPLLMVVLAAMVPVDQSPAEMLAWTGYKQPHGSTSPIWDLSPPKGWTWQELRAAHSQHVSGLRDPRVNEGERIYQRLKKRRQYQRRALERQMRSLEAMLRRTIHKAS